MSSEPKISLSRGESSRSPIPMKTANPNIYLIPPTGNTQFISSSPTHPPAIQRIVSTGAIGGSHSANISQFNNLPIIRGPTRIETIQIQRNETDVVERSDSMSRRIMESRGGGMVVNQMISASGTKRTGISEKRAALPELAGATSASGMNGFSTINGQKKEDDSDLNREEFGRLLEKVGLGED